MTLTYQKRNLENIAKLADHTKAAALQWHAFLVENNIDVLIYETIRTEEQQKKNVQNGKSQTMKSYHLKGQALDFVPIVKGDDDWNGYGRPDIQKAISEAKRLGFEWGGEWRGFVDKPHLQFNYKGYGTDTFGQVVTQPAPKPFPYPGFLIKNGSRNNHVKLIQSKVGTTPDGIFGPKTEAAVKIFQRNHGLSADGIVGPKTWAVMFG